MQIYSGRMTWDGQEVNQKIMNIFLTGFTLISNKMKGEKEANLLDLQRKTKEISKLQKLKRHKLCQLTNLNLLKHIAYNQVIFSIQQLMRKSTRINLKEKKEE